jgi:hypothetical protein
MAIQPYEGKAIDQRYPPHCFEIRTRSSTPNAQLTYCVGENLQALAAKQQRQTNSNWQLWYKALQQALQVCYPMFIREKDKLRTSKQRS